MQNKIFWFCPIIENKKSKAIVNNSTKLDILLSYTYVKDIDFPEAVIRFILKMKNKQTKLFEKL